MRVFVAVLCVGLLAGCTLVEPGQDGSGLSRTRVAGVPFHPQEGFRCGPAAMASVLGWSGMEVAPAALEGQFYAVKDPRAALVETARRYGRLAYPISGTQAMMAELAAGHPVLVLQNLGVSREPLWNCQVAVGFDRQAGKVWVHSGDQPAKSMSLGLFERLWTESEQWGLVVLRPGDLPASVREEDYVRAAKGMEQAGRYWEAVLSYDTALSQWPRNSDAMMGLASSLYLLGDPRGAADAYRAAAASARDPRPALDALSHLLSELGEPQKAVATRTKRQGEPSH